jgi:predicted DNA binding CopG/RHH family protein
MKKVTQPEPLKPMIVRLPESLLRSVKAEAALLGITLQRFVTDALRRELKRRTMGGLR